jgi:hypothetical protein
MFLREVRTFEKGGLLFYPSLIDNVDIATMEDRNRSLPLRQVAKLTDTLLVVAW